MHDKDSLLSSAHCHILMWLSVNLPNNKFTGFALTYPSALYIYWINPSMPIVRELESH